jgi:hypothetical protein
MTRRQVADALEVPEAAAPATPATGFVRIYAKADGKLYIKDDTGLETDITTAAAGGGSSRAFGYFIS